MGVFFHFIFKYYFKFTFYNAILVLYMRLHVFTTKNILATIKSLACRDFKGRFMHQFYFIPLKALKQYPLEY